MEDELLSLKWNNHQATFLRIISDLRSKDAYTDATLACNGRFYSVHKFVLSSCSAYFCAIFDQVATKNLVIVLKDITCNTLEYLLDYMYSGEINVRQHELASLVNAAECLRIKGLAVADDETLADDSNKTTDRQESHKLHGVHKSSDEHQILKNPKVFSDHQRQKKITKNSMKASSGESENSFPENGNIDQTITSAECTNLEGDSLTHTIIKEELVDKSNLLEFSDWADENSMKYEERNHLENFIIENASNKEMILNSKNKEFSISAPGSSRTLDAKLQWESDGQSNSNLENNTSEFSKCLSAIQDLPEFLTNEASLRLGENFRENTALLFSSTIDGYRRKSVFGKLMNSRENILKTYNCKNCSYSCPDPSNFKRHLQTHTGEKPYKCLYCNYRCIHSSNLKSHIRYKHS